MNFKLSGTPTGKRVLVLPDNAEKLYKGKIIIPESSQEKPAKGIVIQTGPGVTICKPGDEVLYGKYSGNFIDFDVSDEQDDSKSKEFLLMIDSDITYVWSCEKEKEKEIDQEARDRVRTYNDDTEESVY